MSDKSDILDIISQLRKHGLSNGGSLGHHSGLYDEAADALESLMEEKETDGKRLINADALCESIDRTILRE